LGVLEGIDSTERDSGVTSDLARIRPRVDEDLRGILSVTGDEFEEDSLVELTTCSVSSVEGLRRARARVRFTKDRIEDQCDFNNFEGRLCWIESACSVGSLFNGVYSLNRFNKLLGKCK
jgi:hypothetical protein